MSQSLPTLGKCLPHEPSGDRRHEHAINAIPEPEAAHINRPDDDEIPDDEREAIDLHTPAQQKASKQKRGSRVLSPNRSSTYGWKFGEVVARLWRHNVTISVPHVDCRDHLGKAALHSLL
jgi:hypothetical protein